MRALHLAASVVAVGAGVAAFLTVGPGRTGPAALARSSVEAAFERAAAAGIEGSGEFTPPANFTEGPPSAGSNITDSGLFAARTVIHRFDWSPLVAKAEGGVPGLVLAQADLHAGILAGAGFVPLDAGETVLRPPGTKDVVRVDIRTTSPGHGRSHGWRSPLDPDRLVHRRLYHAPGTGGFVAVRIEYERAWKAITVESTWLEATGSAGEPRAFPHSFRETLTDAR